MDLKMKQRLVGLLVVLALLAIFMPMISYKMEPKRNTHLSSNIPNPPELPKIQLANNNTPVLQTPLSAAIDWFGIAENAFNNGVQNTTWAQGSGRVFVGDLVTAAAGSDSASIPSAPLKKVAMIKPPKSSPSSLENAHKPVLAQGHWIIQLGTFSNSKNIQVLLGKLSQKGIPSFKEKAFSHNGQNMVRIFVGPLLTENQATQMKKELQQKMHIAGIIKRKTA